MDTKKTLDFAAGRLAKVPTRHGTTRSRPKASSYGTVRLGITPERECQKPEAVEAAPATTTPPPRPAPAKPKLARPRSVARRPDPAPAVVTVTGVMGRLRSLNVQDLRAWLCWVRRGQWARWVSRHWALAAATGVVATVAVAWSAFSGGPESPLGPQTPARAQAAAAPAPPARPARPAERKLEPAKPKAVTLDKPAPPAHRYTARQVQGFWAKMASLPSSWLEELRQARARVQANLPATAPQPQEPPKPQGAPAPTPPTFDYVPCPPGFHFTGAVQSADATFANINGHFVRVGGKVNGAVVVEITASSAVLEQEGKRFIVGFDTGSSTPASQDEDDAGQAKKPPATTQPAAGTGKSGD